MKKLLSCGGVFLLFLAIIVLAVPLACIITVAVPAFNKDVREEIACPPGTKLVSEWIQTTYTRPGEKVLSAYCLDGEGNKLQTEDIGYGALEYYPKYYVISLAVTFAATILVVIPLVILFQILRKKFFPKPPAPPSSTIELI